MNKQSKTQIIGLLLRYLTANFKGYDRLHFEYPIQTQSNGVITDIVRGVGRGKWVCKNKAGDKVKFDLLPTAKIKVMAVRIARERASEIIKC